MGNSQSDLEIGRVATSQILDGLKKPNIKMVSLKCHLSQKRLTDPVRGERCESCVFERQNLEEYFDLMQNGIISLLATAAPDALQVSVSRDEYREKRLPLSSPIPTSEFPQLTKRANEGHFTDTAKALAGIVHKTSAVSPQGKKTSGKALIAGQASSEAEVEETAELLSKVKRSNEKKRKRGENAIKWQKPAPAPLPQKRKPGRPKKIKQTTALVLSGDECSAEGLTPAKSKPNMFLKSLPTQKKKAPTKKSHMDDIVLVAPRPIKRRRAPIALRPEDSPTDFVELVLAYSSKSGKRYMWPGARIGYLGHFNRGEMWYNPSDGVRVSFFGEFTENHYWVAAGGYQILTDDLIQELSQNPEKIIDMGTGMTEEERSEAVQAFNQDRAAFLQGLADAAAFAEQFAREMADGRAIDMGQKSKGRKKDTVAEEDNKMIEE